MVPMKVVSSLSAHAGAVGVKGRLMSAVTTHLHPMASQMPLRGELKGDPKCVELRKQALEAGSERGQISRALGKVDRIVTDMTTGEGNGTGSALGTPEILGGRGAVWNECQGKGTG